LIERIDMLPNLARATLLGLVLVAASALSPAPARAQDIRPLVQGETVYVPVYSEILYGNLGSSGKPSRMPVSAMLSIRNVDEAAGITINSVRYYDGAGKLLRELLDQPAILGPLATTEVFVEHKDMSGGTGANFIVVWQSAEPVNPPIVEAVHAYFFGNQSIAFVSPGRPIRPKGS
jgi:hypothetical protein